MRRPPKKPRLERHSSDLPALGRDGRPRCLSLANACHTTCAKVQVSSIFYFQNMIEFSNITFHYYLKDGLHSMNALTRNKCEQELLDLFEELCDLYAIDAEILSAIREEGGIKEFWKVVSESSAGIQAICAILILFFTGATYFANLPDEEKTSLEKELLKLQIADIKNKNPPPEKSNAYESISALDALYDLQSRKTAILNRSDFYSSLLSDERVTEFGAVSEGTKWNEKKVKRERFTEFVVKNAEKKTEDIGYVEINLISPVFKSRKYKWRGLIGDQVISFKVSDRAFNKLVKDKVFSFKNEDVIECTLKVKGDVDFFDDWVNRNFFVTKVHAIVSDNKRIRLTSAAPDKRQDSKAPSNQFGLFEDSKDLLFKTT